MNKTNENHEKKSIKTNKNRKKIMVFAIVDEKTRFLDRFNKDPYC